MELRTVRLMRLPVDDGSYIFRFFVILVTYPNSSLCIYSIKRLLKKQSIDFLGIQIMSGIINTHRLESIKRCLDGRAKASPMTVEEMAAQAHEIMARYGDDSYLEGMKKLRTKLAVRMYSDPEQ